jgi:hypothetical protein
MFGCTFEHNLQNNIHPLAKHETCDYFLVLYPQNLNMFNFKFVLHN